HADTFHPTVKAWLFLTDVAADAGPFTYVPGSHILTPARLDWERRMSLDAGRSHNPQIRQGSFRLDPAELDGLGLRPPRVFAVPANTLLVADTFGFHARGPSASRSLRVEIWAYGRRSPFVPWAAFDPWSGVALARRSLIGWRLGDLAANVTRLLAERWPQAEIVGVDGSPEMLARAAAELPHLAWEQADLAAWRPHRAPDLIYSNAALHWIEGHRELIVALFGALAPGGTLAIQMPRNFAAPSHRSMGEAARMGPWRSVLE